MLDTQVAKGLDGLDNDGVNILFGVRVVTLGALGEPLHNVEAFGAVEQYGVAVEEIREDSHVATLGEAVSHELAVLPDANDVGQVEDTDILAGDALGRGGEVGVDVVGNLDGLALGLAPVQYFVSITFIYSIIFFILFPLLVQRILVIREGAVNLRLRLHSYIHLDGGVGRTRSTFLREGLYKRGG